MVARGMRSSLIQSDLQWCKSYGERGFQLSMLFCGLTNDFSLRHSTGLASLFLSPVVGT